MLELDNLKLKLNDYKKPLKEIYDSLDLNNKINRLKEIEMSMQDQNFWSDIEKANKLTKEAKLIKDNIDKYNDLNSSFEDLSTMIDLVNEENDKNLLLDLEKQFDSLVKNIEKMHNSLLLSGEYDDLDAIVRLNSGAGGTESCDFCSMLFRMYTMFAKNHDFLISIIDYLDGEEAGIKSVTFSVKGDNAYGFFKSEMGVHRLVRISPFNAQGKRQTSFVSCDVMPDIKEDVDIEIKDEDIKMDVYRASGAGGQHVNKTSSAVRLTHIPTGIVVACQEERSQFHNKDRAMQMLKAKLFLIKQQENSDKLETIRGEVKDNAFGSQIRSYVLQPYRMVKDLRTGEETGNTDAVLNGELDKFVIAYLNWLKLGCPDRKIQKDDE